MVTTDNPRIYVASLSDYNAGRLHGAWIDLDETTTEGDIMESVKAMLEKSPEPIAEEWAIHDYEGFGGIRLSEYESFERVAQLAAKIAEHGDPFLAWMTYDSANDPDTFEDAYEGEYSSVEDYAQDYAESCRLLESVPESLRYHIDWESYANDLDIYDVPAPNGNVYVFDRNA
jgi:antirestriction protein